MVVFVDVVVQVFETLQKELSFLYGKVVWDIGNRIGRYEGRKYKEEVGFESLKEMMEGLKEYVTLIGICDEMTFEIKGKDIIIRTRGLVPGAYLKSRKPVDHFMAGFLKGWIEENVGKCDVKETRCQAEGSEYCEFHVRLRTHGGS